MFNDTCLIAHKIIDQSPRIYCLEILVYSVLKSSYVGFETNSLMLKQTIIQMEQSQEYA
jgi:hypothetical protein